MNIDYEINKDTLLIMDNDGEQSTILENDNDYYIPHPAMEVIEHSCEYFGSSYEGRHQGTQKLLGISHKTPIIIEETNNIIFFPTCSPRSKDCMWIALNQILSYKQARDSRKSIIEFKNGRMIEVNTSIGSLNNQILIASRLDLLVRERK